MVKAYGVYIDRNLETSEFNCLMNLVSEEKRLRIMRYHRFEDRQRSLIGDVLARYAICEGFGISNSSISLTTNEYGKPLLLEPQGIHFNISHSGDWVVCATDINPVGIDVESINPIELRIAERFFSKSEYADLLAKDEDYRINYFYLLWTLKESYIKAEGKGLSIPLASFSIKLIDGMLSVWLGDTLTDYNIKHWNLDKKHDMGLCTKSHNPCDIIRFNTNDFYCETKKQIK